jgi:hypothetical protein
VLGEDLRQLPDTVARSDTQLAMDGYPHPIAHHVTGSL